MSRVLLAYQPTDGGVGRHVHDVAEGLVRSGYEVVLCGPGIPGHPVEGADHRRLELRRAVSPRVDLAAVADFARIVREVRPDLIHAHSSKAGAVTRLARIAHPRVPLLYSPHGYAFAGYFERPAERRVYRLAERLLAPAATRVICVCEAEARLARAVGSPSRVRVVHNGIAPAVEGPIDRRIEELAARGPVIGALTLLRPGKGLETLIDATPRVLARHPRAQVAIVGDGPGHEALVARARLLGVEDAMHFLGPSDEPLSALRGMGVFVHPSWAEAFPYVILEAMSLGRPLVACDVGGIGEALVDGSSGVLVAPRDPPALAAALADLLDQPETMASIGRNALHRVSDRFTLAAMIGQLAEVYDEVR
jgi:glycosyltransferase involved in cell wall biosynthesis